MVQLCSTGRFRWFLQSQLISMGRVEIPRFRWFPCSQTSHRFSKRRCHAPAAAIQNVDGGQADHGVAAHAAQETWNSQLSWIQPCSPVVAPEVLDVHPQKKYLDKYGGHWMIPDFLTRKMMQKGKKNAKRSVMFMVKVVLNRGMGFQILSKTHFRRSLVCIWEAALHQQTGRWLPTRIREVSLQLVVWSENWGPQSTSIVSHGRNIQECWFVRVQDILKAQSKSSRSSRSSRESTFSPRLKLDFQTTTKPGCEPRQGPKI